MKLTHSDLCSLSERLGYKNHGSGLCAGFTGMLAQAAWVQDEASFYKRLDLISTYKNDFSVLIDEIDAIKEKIAKGDYLPAEREKELLDILSFFDGMELYLNPHAHSDLFNDYVTQENLNNIYSLAGPVSQAEQYPSILLETCCAGNASHLIDYFDDLAEKFNQSSTQPILFLQSGDHIVYLSYDKNKHCWVYVDTNDFEVYDNPYYYRELNTPELVTSLFHSFDNDIGAHTVFAMTVTTSNPDHSLKNHLQDFALKYRITSEDALIYDHNNMGLLHLACTKGNLDVVSELLKNKQININQPMTDKSITPLYIACESRHLDILKLLTEQDKIDINMISNGFTPLHLACERGFVEVVQLLLIHRNINVNQVSSEGLTPLYHACKNGNLEIVKLLIEHKKIEINKTNHGFTSLHLACEQGNSDLVKLLLTNKKINVNQTTSEGLTPLYYACQNGNMDIVRLLIEHKKIEINKTIQGFTPLHLACEQGNPDLVKLLLTNKKINVNQPEPHGGGTPLFYACNNGHQDIVEALLKEDKIEINKTTNDGGLTALHIACENGHTDIVRMLLKEEKTNINQATLDGGLTALHIACENGHTDIARLLIKEEKTNINQAITEDGTTPLYYASKNGQLEIVQALLARKEDIDVNQTTNQISPLLIACHNGHLAIVQALLDHPLIDVNQSSNDITPLYIACHNGYTEIAKLLIEHKKNQVNQTNDGATPLHLACEQGHLGLVQLLAAHEQINMAIKNKDGDTALDIAFRTRHYAIITALLEKAKKQDSPLPSIMSSDSLTKAIAWAKLNKLSSLTEFLSPTTNNSPAEQETQIPQKDHHLPPQKQRKAGEATQHTAKPTFFTPFNSSSKHAMKQDKQDLRADNDKKKI